MLENLDGLLERSQRGLLRIQKIVADLRDFAHLEEAEFKEADLNAGISTTVRLMQTLAGARQVTLETSLAPIPTTTCFPAKINLVVQSLISNAIDACPDGGRVVVETRAVDDGIEIRVSDNGCGIAPAIRDRDLRPVLHHQARRQGDGAGPLDQLRDRQGPRRDDRFRVAARPGHAIHDRDTGRDGSRNRAGKKWILMTPERVLCRRAGVGAVISPGARGNCAVRCSGTGRK